MDSDAESLYGVTDLLGSICPELGVVPLVDPGTDCEDELPAPADMPAVGNQDMDCHLDLAQLWRCPVAWCTIWKGALQDLTDHVRYAHRVPEEVQNVRLEKLIPPWTVTRKVYMESLTYWDRYAQSWV